MKLYEVLDVCNLCGDKYYRSKYTSNSKYCSRKCITDASRREVSTVCQNCKKKLMRQQGRVKKYPTQYCDKKCQNEHYKDRFKGKNNPNYKNIIKICLQCKKEFVHYVRQRKFCSMACRAESQKTVCICEHCKKSFKRWDSLLKGRKEIFCTNKCRLDHSTQKGDTTINCKQCKKLMKIKKCMVNKKFCSRQCVLDFKVATGQFKGKNNPRYEDGRSFSRKNYRGEDWDVQRNKAYERDDHMCQKCGEQIRIAAHHIIPYHISKNNHITNLICLCASCHMTEENYFRQFKKPSQFVSESMQRFNKKKYPFKTIPIKVK